MRAGLQHASGTLRMKVVIASRIFTPEPAAASFRLSALATALSSHGAAVTVLTTRALGGASASDPKMRVSRWPVLRNREGQVRGYLQYLSFDIPLFFRLLFSRGVDGVVVEPPPTTGTVVRVVCAVKRIPYIYYAADVWSDAAAATGVPRIVELLLRSVERFAFRGATLVLAVSDGIADRIRELAPNVDIKVVKNGVDTAVFHPGVAERSRRPTAVYAGTMSEWQGAEIFLAALPQVLERVPDARLVFIGSGSARPEIERLAAELGIGAVEILATLQPPLAAQWLRSARVALVSLKPGQGYDFAIPTKIFAAAATGTPVLFSGTGPSADLVKKHALGQAVAYELSAVSAAMSAMLERAPTLESDQRISRWAEHNVSISRTGAQASGLVVETLSRCRQISTVCEH
ncbi:MAG: glycosyltransferase family 4 protein [Terrimesophilobacter sp.]